MFAIPTVIAAFAPLWIALVAACCALAFSLALIGDTLKSKNTSEQNREVAHV